MTVTQSDSASLNSVIKFKVKEVVLHHHPDLDSIAAFWLAKKHPEVFAILMTIISGSLFLRRKVRYPIT